MTALITTCRQCRADFDPSHDAIIRGEWRTCPACRLPPPSSPVAATADCRQLATGAPDLSAFRPPFLAGTDRLVRAFR